MKKVKQMLQYFGMKINENDGDNIYANDGVVKYLVVPPHKGNHFHYVLRISTCAAFDRWANSIPIEEFFDTENELIDYIGHNQLTIYKTLLKYLSEEYYYLQKDFEEETKHPI